MISDKATKGVIEVFRSIFVLFSDFVIQNKTKKMSGYIPMAGSSRRDATVQTAGPSRKDAATQTINGVVQEKRWLRDRVDALVRRNVDLERMVAVSVPETSTPWCDRHLVAVVIMIILIVILICLSVFVLLNTTLP